MNNEKLENLLNLALNATPEEREKSLELNVGYDTASRSWEVIVKASGGFDLLPELFPQITIHPLLNGYGILTVPADLLDALSERPEIEYMEKPKRLFFAVNSGRSASCITPLQTTPAPERNNLYGSGIITAIIDSGIDYAHPDFCNTDGTTRILELWDQSLDRIFTQAEINEALQAPSSQERYQLVPSRDLSGHGTHVAGIAAGNGRASNGQYRGVAPLSSLLIVKLGISDPDGFPRTTELMRAVDYVLQKAFSWQMPVAINLSFGNNYGSHDGATLLETYLDNVSSYWKSCIVTGTGNEGASRIHTSGSFLTNSSPVTIPFSVSDYESGLNIQLWKSYADEIEVTLRHPNGTIVGPFQERLGTYRFTAGTTELLVYYGKPSPYSISQEIYLDFISQGSYIDAGIWELTLNPRRITAGSYDLWLPGESVIGSGTGFLYPTETTTLTIPSTAAKVISVGAYNAAFNSYAAFSGRGFTRMEHRIKPDLAAPGVNIISAAPGGGYTSKSGTSMAAPFVTGSCALLMEWGIVRGNDPYLYSEKVKAYLIRGTKKLACLHGIPQSLYRVGHSVYGRQYTNLKCTVILIRIRQLTLSRITRQVSPTFNSNLLLCYSYFYFIKMPDIIYIFLNGSVRREFSNMCHIQHNEFCPAFLVSVSFLHTLLSLCVRTEVFQAEVSISELCALCIEQ